MKTKELSFEEALKILEEGKCEGIRPEKWHTCTSFYKKDERGALRFCHEDKFRDVNLELSTFLGKWNLVGAKPEKHKRVINNIVWCRDFNGCIYPTSMQGTFDWSQLLDKPDMKITCEWEK